MSTPVVLVDLDDTLLPDVAARDAALVRALTAAGSERRLADALTIVRAAGGVPRCEQVR